MIAFRGPAQNSGKISIDKLVILCYYIENKKKGKIKLMTKIIKPIISIIFRMIVIAIFLWMVLSYIEVISHNLDYGYIYSNWNLFVILF